MATIAAVNALAFGGGCEVAMACDVRIAAKAAVFGQPEIKLGIIPGFGGTQRLPRLVGANKALEMNLVGDAVLAEEALDSGLVNRVVPDHELFETALKWARKLAGQAPLAVGQIKRASHKGDLDEGIEAEKQGFATAFQRGCQGGHRAPSSASAPRSGAASTTDAPLRLDWRGARSSWCAYLCSASVLADPPHPAHRCPSTTLPDAGLAAGLVRSSARGLSKPEARLQSAWASAPQPTIGSLPTRPRLRSIDAAAALPGPGGLSLAGTKSRASERDRR